MGVPNSEMIFQVPAEVSKVTTMGRRSVRIVVDTQENLTDEQMGRLMSLHEKIGWFTFSVEEIAPDVVLSLPALSWDKDEKSPGQILRGCLFRLWERDKPTETFNEYYARALEKISNQIREKLA